MDKLSREDKNILFEKTDTFPAPYGIHAAVSLLVAFALFYVGGRGITKSITCMFMPGTKATNIDLEIVFVIAGVIAVITSLAFAGAAIATNSQSILGTFVLVLFILPLIYLIGVVLIDLPLDFSLFSAFTPNVTPTVDINQNGMSSISSSACR